MSKDKKKIKTVFYIKSENPNGIEIAVTAGGVILYRIQNNELQLLLMTNRGKYEDLGGTSESGDKNIYETVAREVSEESNGLVERKNILKRIKVSNYIYSKTSKYILFIIKADKDESELVSEQFGDRENHDNVPRTVDWVPLSVFLNSETIKNKLNFRLKNRNIFEYLKKLSPDSNFDQSRSNSISQADVLYLF